MEQTALARPFQVLSRVGGGVALTDKESLLKMVVEVDLFNILFHFRPLVSLYTDHYERKLEGVVGGIV
jgi:hypothetical protein